MSKKHTLKKAGALLLGLALTVGSTGCNFFPADTQKDLAQVVAEVNIYKSLKDIDGYSKSAEDVNSLIKNGQLASSITKSELVSMFINVGYSYVQEYGLAVDEVIEMLMNSLVNTEIMTQYAVAYYLQSGLSIEGCKAYINAELGKASKEEKDFLEAHPEVLTMKYFLTENGTDMDEYNLAEYSLLKSLNDSLDSMEASYIEEEESHDHGEARTLPTAISTEKEDFYPKKADGSIDYNVYTGRNTLDSCGIYEKVEGSTVSTRKKAYNVFLANLQSYGLVSENDNTVDIKTLDYYYVELASSLSQALINKYFDSLNDEAYARLTDEYVATKYDEIVETQESSYKNSTSAFETAIGQLSDDSFVLYGSDGFGFVYNILIPFSASQEQAYSAEKNKGLTQSELFDARKEILEDVKAKDLRDSWFSVHDHANYAYEESDAGKYFNNGKIKGDNTYLFFKDSMVETERYEALTQYAGMYPYNGKVEKDDHEYTFTPNKLTIKEFVTEMESYINFVVGDNVAKGDYQANYYDEEVAYVDADGVVDYNKFLYYKGKVALENTKASDYFNAENNDSYKALSAVNELMFAYSTDLGCLNSYMGYAVNPVKTNFVPEFEYAAQEAVENGVGTYVVCGTDYGWHIIYVSFVYDGTDVYGGYNADEKEVKGTFSNLFYESLKATTATSYSSSKQNNVLKACNNDDSVTLYTKRYQDLMDMSL